MFYPATYSPYKNHDFLLSINEYAIKNNIDTSGIEIKLTLKEEEYDKYRAIKFVKNLGRLNAKHMNIEYQKTDVLLFLSSSICRNVNLLDLLLSDIILLTLACSNLLFSSSSVEILSSLGGEAIVDLVATFPITSRVHVFGFCLRFLFVFDMFRKSFVALIS